MPLRRILPISTSSNDPGGQDWNLIAWGVLDSFLVGFAGRNCCIESKNSKLFTPFRANAEILSWAMVGIPSPNQIMYTAEAGFNQQGV